MQTNSINILHVVQSADATASEQGHAIPLTIKINGDHLLTICELLQKNPSVFFDQLSCITGIDNGPESGALEVIYHLYSIPFHRSLALKVVVPRDNPVVESVSSIWKSANWLEREIFDMYGIHFNNHPDLRRILMPADWEGHPLRKDYRQQETYRGITVNYDRT